MALIQTQAVKKLPFLDNGNVYYVAPGGNNLTAQKGNPFKPWADPWTAVGLASSGDMVYVFAGVYDLGVQASRNLAKDGVRIHFERVYFDEITGNASASLFTISGQGEQYVSGELCFWSDIANTFMVSTQLSEGFIFRLEGYKTGHVAIGENECFVSISGVYASDTNTPDVQTGPSIGLIRDMGYTLSGNGICEVQYSATYFWGRFVNFLGNSSNLKLLMNFDSGRLQTENNGITALWGGTTSASFSNCFLSINFNEVKIAANNANMGLIPMDLLSTSNNNFSFTAQNAYIERGTLIRPRTPTVRSGSNNKFNIEIKNLEQRSGKPVIEDLHLSTSLMTINIGNCIQSNFAGPMIQIPASQIQAGATVVIKGNYIQEEVGQPTINIDAALGAVIINASGQGGTGLVGSANCAAVLYQDGTGTTVV